MFRNYVEELSFLAVEGGGEPIGHGAADGGDVAVGGFEAILDGVAKSAFGLASFGA